MERFEFDNREATCFPNSNRKNGVTVRGKLELYDNFPRAGLLSLDIRGPEGAYRGSAILDKATAGKLGAALLKWAGVVQLEDLLVEQKRLLAEMNQGPMQ